MGHVSAGHRRYVLDERPGPLMSGGSKEMVDGIARVSSMRLA